MEKPNSLETALILVVDALRELNSSQRQRLRILDSQIEALNKTLDGLCDAINDLKAVCVVCSRLNVLCLNNEADASKTKQEEPGTTDDIDKLFKRSWN